LAEGNSAPTAAAAAARKPLVGKGEKRARSFLAKLTVYDPKLGANTENLRKGMAVIS